MVDLERLRRRVAPALLVGGLAASVVVLGRDWPRDQELTLKVEGARDRIRRIDVAFERLGEDPVAGATFAFPTGPPRSLHTTAHLANGTWDVVVTFEDASGSRTTVRRSARFEGGSITLTLPAEAGDAP